MDYTISNHTRNELINRQIPISLMEQVISNPQQKIRDEFDTFIYQSIIKFPNGKDYLLRVVVAERVPLHVITIYRTSKINKYWRKKL
ncbi:MAG: DUF4258 domain-containing protein [Ignavibacteriae bacterium]|nr:DUF4258 domain-containing protein [Ignavibacteriota bacterium]